MSDHADMSRRDFVRGRLWRSIRAAAGVPTPTPLPTRAPVALPIRRPPGAVPEARFLAECTRCNACIEACPVHAITLAPARYRQAAGTPILEPTAACVMCPDTPCIRACEPGVLRADRPLKMGTAWIDRSNCLAHRGTLCTVCSERCPVPGAIRLDHGRPVIQEAVCTGCGLCATVCPAPVNAIAILPLPDRPPDPSPGSPGTDRPGVVGL